MALSGNLYRFEAGCDDEYEAVRAAGDAALGLVAPDTCIEPAATAYRDSRGRLMLRVSSSSAVYAAIASSLDQLIAVGTVVVNPGEEPAPSAAGASSAVLVSFADALINSFSGSNVQAALESVDVALEDRITPAQFIASFSTGLAVSGGIVSVAFGTTSTTVCAGNDARLSNARTPTAHTHSAADITSGVFSTARLASSGTASASTFLRGDGAWAAAGTSLTASQTAAINLSLNRLVR